MSLKAEMKKLSEKENVSVQLLLQNFMLECFLRRVSFSKYQANFILKGGFLISSLVGLETRSTMDLDATIKGYPVKKETLMNMIKDLIAIDANDGVIFSFLSLERIREKDDYSGFRVSLVGKYSTLVVPLKVDMTTGDKITPAEIEYVYHPIVGDQPIRVLAYNLPTLLAEKLETILSRGELNTRMRDFYDVYILSHLQMKNIDAGILKEAIKRTATKRGSYALLIHYKTILERIRGSEEMKNQWINYQRSQENVSKIDFSDICISVGKLMELIMNRRED
jgi:predicted nucleotidyltransferase component of viral defense system